jgi:uncharacterized protein YdeI (YjbR/CyaY-like superfamily)
MIRPFKNSATFRSWLKRNHRSSEGIWIQIFKANSGKTTVTYAQALDEALCFGWIDGQKKKYNEISWLQRFCPRRKKSGWSKTNQKHVARLIKAKKMTPAGLEAVNAAKTDGRWKQAYNSPANLKIPSYFMSELKKHKKAKAFFDTLNRANLYTISYRLETAKKPETRARRMKVILEHLKAGKKFH